MLLSTLSLRVPMHRSAGQHDIRGIRSPNLGSRSDVSLGRKALQGGNSGCLARISHRLSTAAADPGMSAALRSVGFLDVLSSTPAESSRRAPCIHARLRRLATKPCEKSGLERLEAMGLWALILRGCGRSRISAGCLSLEGSIFHL